MNKQELIIRDFILIGVLCITSTLLVNRLLNFVWVADVPVTIFTIPTYTSDEAIGATFLIMILFAVIGVAWIFHKHPPDPDTYMSPSYF